MITVSCSSARAVVRTGAVALALLPNAASQVPVEWTPYTAPGTIWAPSFAEGLATIDLDSDGFDDLIVAEPNWTVGTEQSAGRMWVLYGPLPLQESLSFTSSQPVEGENLGEADVFGLGSSCISAGDVDQDGHTDLLVGAPGYSQLVPLIGGAGRAHLFFGPDFTREVLYHDPTPEMSNRFGRATLLADVSGDGVVDVLIAAPGAKATGAGHVALDDAGEVWAWMSDDGFQVPIRLASPHPMDGDRFGWSLDVVSLAGQEPDTLMVSAIGHSNSDPYSGGVIYAYRVPDLAPVTTIESPPLPLGVPFDFGDIAYCGDLTSDGIDDLVVSAWGSYVSCQGQGAVLVLEGPAFDSVLNVLTSPKACQSDFDIPFGLRTAVADFDGDGVPDIIVSSGSTLEGDARVYIHYGPDFASVQELGDDFPFGLAGELTVGDHDGDGWVECGVGFAGTVYVFDVRTLLADAETLPTSAGATVSFTVDGASSLAGGAYLAALSVSGSMPGLVPGAGVHLPLNFDPITAVGLSLVNGPILPGFAGILDVTGNASFQLVLPPGSAGGLLGQTLTVAVALADASGHLVAASSAVGLIVGP